MTLFATDLFATDTLTIALLCVCIMQYYFAIIDLLMCYTFFVIACAIPFLLLRECY